AANAVFVQGGGSRSFLCSEESQNQAVRLHLRRDALNKNAGKFRLQVAQEVPADQAIKELVGVVEILAEELLFIQRHLVFHKDGILGVRVCCEEILHVNLDPKIEKELNVRTNDRAEVQNNRIFLTCHCGD